MDKEATCLQRQPDRMYQCTQDRLVGVGNIDMQPHVTSLCCS